jgi:Arc/MetJ-type ribon-helix-helix transcriptional regulator
MSKFPPTEAPDELVRFAEAQIAAGRFTSMEQVVRAGVESLKERAEAEEAWLGFAREKWRSGKESSARDEAVEMDDGQFDAFLDESLSGAARQ